MCLIVALIVALAATVSGCSRQPDVSGVWKGTCKLAQKNAPSKGANADVQFAMAQSAAAVNGNIRIKFTNARGLGEPDLTIKSGVLADGKLILTAGGASNAWGGEAFHFEGQLQRGTLTGTAEYSFPSVFSTITLAGDLSLQK